MKKVISGFLVCLLLVTLAGCTGKKGEDFPTWKENASAIAALKDYVEAVTDEKSEDFIPVEDRIAAFDLDGTLYCETFPIYGEWLMFAQRALNDPSYDAPERIRRVAETVIAAGESRSIPPELEEDEINAQAEAFSGMPIEDYTAYVEQFKETEAEGFENMKRGEAFYQPMLEIVSYLEQHDFTVYICSGTNRFTVRALIDGVIDIPARQVIGSDFTIEASGQGDTGDMHYTITREDDLLMGDALIIKNVKMSKVSQLQQELGQKPVLVFGNSTGDVPMALYSDTENPYPTEVFFLLCDDMVREHGDEEKAETIRGICAENGWNTISMADDWTTIYGDEVGLSK